MALQIGIWLQFGIIVWISGCAVILCQIDTFAAACLRKFPLSPVNPTVFVTSTSAAYVEKMQQNSKSMFYSKATQKPPGPIWIFGEDSWDISHGRKPLDRNKLHFPSCVIDVFKAVPWLYNISTHGGAIDQFYAFSGRMEPCDQPLKMKSGKLLIRKLASIHYAITNLPTATTVIWLDTDVVFDKPPDSAFYQFVSKFDITYIPFTTNTVWGIPPVANFVDIESPYWRIESGIVAVTVTKKSIHLFDRANDLYRGKLLKLVIDCLTDDSSHPHLCREIWFQRNVYLDDIFAFSMLLHQTKRQINQGWFFVGTTKGYPFSHLQLSQTTYTSPFDLSDYFHHYIGKGAYSSGFRFSKIMPDDELLFSRKENFNNTIEFRFPSATPERLKDYLWDAETLFRNQKTNGILPANGKPRFMGATSQDWPISREVHSYSLPSDEPDNKKGKASWFSWL